MNIGYARVSTAEQDNALQLDALKRAGCERIFEETASGAREDRRELKRALEHARDGDVLIVWRLDRLARSMVHLIRIMTDLRERGIQFRSLTETIDTTTPSGMLVFHIFASLAEFERALIRERARAGMEAARARGRIGGRPRKTVTAAEITDLLKGGERTASHVATKLGISRATLYRIISK